MIADNIFWYVGRLKVDVYENVEVVDKIKLWGLVAAVTTFQAWYGV